MVLPDYMGTRQVDILGLEHSIDIHESCVLSYIKWNIHFRKRVDLDRSKSSNRVLILFKVHKMKYL